MSRPAGRTGPQRPSRPMPSSQRGATRLSWWRFPMGGTLACLLAEHHPEIRGMVLVNPYVEPPARVISRHPARPASPTASRLAPAVGSDIAKDGVVRARLHRLPARGCALTVRGHRRRGRRVSGASNAPSSLLSSRQDHVVPPSSGDLLATSESGPVERVWLEQSYHVATLDNDAQEIVDRTVAFVTKVFAEGSNEEVVAESAR